MTRTVRDAALLLGAACGVDPRDPATAASAGRFHADYTRFLDPGGLEGARLGIARSFPGFDPRVLEVFDRAVQDLRDAGAILVDPATLPQPADVFQELPTLVLNYEFKANINRYFATLGPTARVKSLAELIAFNDANRDRELPHFGQERLVTSEATSGLDAPEYRRAVATIQRAMRADGIDALMDRHRLDAIVAPTMGFAWLTDHVMGDRLDGGGSAGPAAIAGYPDISVPMGLVQGLPVGISFFGRAWSEPTLVRIAYAYEQATKRREPPQYLSSLG
jgi:amidase